MDLLSFVGAFAVACALVYAPGYPVLRACGLPRTWAAIAAPGISTALFAVLSLAYCAAGVPCNPLTVAVVPFALACIVLYLVKDRVHPLALPELDKRYLLLYLAVGLAVGAIVFLRVLPSLDSFAQAWDNIHHLNGIRSFAEAQAFDMLHETAYLADMDINPIPDAGFYPATWQAVCAMVLQATGAHGGTVENAVNYLFSSVAFPLSCLGFAAFVFRDNKRAVRLGAFAVVAFPLFPWEMLAYGPLYANLASFACLPIAQFLFANAINGEGAVRDRVKSGALFFVVLVAIAFLQPNAVFTMALLLAPYCVQKIAEGRGLALALPKRAGDRVGAGNAGSVRIPSWLLAVAFALLCVGIWVFAYQAPFMQKVVQADVWHWQFATVEEALANVASLAYVGGFYTSPAQPLSAVLVIAGIVRTFFERRYLWMSAAYVLTCSTVVATMTGSDFAKALLGGFWYSDPFRCGVMATLAAMPLLILGLDWLLELLAKGSQRFAKRGSTRTAYRACAGVALAVFALVTFAPNFMYDANAPKTDFLDDEGEIDNTSFTSASETLMCWYTYDYGPYTADEKAFVDRVVDQIGENELVVNQPYDGSAFAYGENGLSTYYRKSHDYTLPEETEESDIVRGRLCDVATDSDVQEVLREIGARYILVLHRYNMPESFIEDQYWPYAWRGVNGVTDDTPGVEVVLAEGDMRLYRITCL